MFGASRISEFSHVVRGPAHHAYLSVATRIGAAILIVGFGLASPGLVAHAAGVSDVRQGEREIRDALDVLHRGADNVEGGDPSGGLIDIRQAEHDIREGVDFIGNGAGDVEGTPRDRDDVRQSERDIRRGEQDIRDAVEVLHRGADSIDAGDSEGGLLDVRSAEQDLRTAIEVVAQGATVVEDDDRRLADQRNDRR